MRRGRILLALSMLSLQVYGCSQKVVSDWDPKQGFISNEATAIRVAAAVLINIMGSDAVNNEKPFVAKLRDGKWVVEGTMHDIQEGGVAHIEIQKSDGKILLFTHGK